MGLIHRIGCVLLYDEECNNDGIDIHWFSTIFNYIVLLMNYMIVLALMNMIDVYKGVGSRPRDNVVIPSFFSAFLCFWFVVAIQIIFCLLVHCTGVSIIRNLLFTWVRILEKTATDTIPPVIRSLSMHKWVLSRAGVVLKLDMITFMYYAVTSKFILTLANTCALVLGSVLWEICGGQIPII